MLEDESGRIKLVGDVVKKAGLVTGVVVAALGAETANGDFEVIELCYPGLAPSPPVENAEEDSNGMDVDGMTTPCAPDAKVLTNHTTSRHFQ